MNTFSKRTDRSPIQLRSILVWTAPEQCECYCWMNICIRIPNLKDRPNFTTDSLWRHFWNYTKLRKMLNPRWWSRSRVRVRIRYSHRMMSILSPQVMSTPLNWNFTHTATLFQQCCSTLMKQQRLFTPIEIGKV